MSSFLSNPLVVSLIGALVCTAILIFTVFKKSDDENGSSPFQFKKVLLTFGLIYGTILIIHFLSSGTKGKTMSGGSLADVMKGGASTKPDLPILTDAFD